MKEIIAYKIINNKIILKFQNNIKKRNIYNFSFIKLNKLQIKELKNEL